MSVRSACCSNCENRLPVGPGFLNPFKLPPHWLECGSCGCRLKTSFNHRATWASWAVWELSWIASTILIAVIAIMKGNSVEKTFAITACGSLLIGVAGGFFLSLIVALPIQVLLDVTRFVLIKLNVIAIEANAATIPIDENARHAAS